MLTKHKPYADGQHLHVAIATARPKAAKATRRD